ncbi:MAG: MerR family transcriptional regulator [Pseudomonadota bacterium]
MAEKSRDAFRTISEVADWLDVPTHVLRFWESRFSQIKPVKRAGGRRYYRPSDMRVIGGVKVLLHDQGMTIRGVQKLFREEGIKHVSGYAPDLFTEDEQVTPRALNEEALERAARPANAARSTHSAEPDPDAVVEVEGEIEVETLPAAKEAPEADVPPLFRRARPDETPAPSETSAPATPARTIPVLPDVPAIDVADDDPTHEKDPGFAARLKLATPEAFVAHRALLSDAADRLRAIVNRAE